MKKAIDNRWSQGWDKKKSARKAENAKKINKSLFSRAFKKLEDQMDGDNKTLKAVYVLVFFAVALIIMGMKAWILPLVFVGFIAVVGLLVSPIFLVKPSMRGYFYGGRAGADDDEKPPKV